MFRPITISAALNGFTVTVGCQTLVYNDPAQLLAHLKAYLADPDATTKQFIATEAINRKHTLGDPPLCETARQSPPHPVNTSGEAGTAIHGIGAGLCAAAPPPLTPYPTATSRL